MIYCIILHLYVLCYLMLFICIILYYATYMQYQLLSTGQLYCITLYLCYLMLYHTTFMLYLCCSMIQHEGIKSLSSSPIGIMAIKSLPLLIHVKSRQSLFGYFSKSENIQLIALAPRQNGTNWGVIGSKGYIYPFTIDRTNKNLLASKYSAIRYSSDTDEATDFKTDYPLLNWAFNV